MRKKFWALLLAVIFLFINSACQEKESTHFTDPDFFLETDANSYMFMGVSYRFAESPKGYYYCSSGDTTWGFLHFIDKTTMQDITLCGKPDCLHENDPTFDSDSDKKKCNAFLGSVKNICYYDGAIYAVVSENLGDFYSRDIRYYLKRINLDGTAHKNVWEITFDKEIENPYPGHRALIHRGRFYFTVGHSQMDELGNYILEEALDYVYSYDLNTKELKLIDKCWGMGKLLAKGDHLYFERKYNTPETLAGITSENICYTISTGEYQSLGKDTYLFLTRNKMLLGHRAPIETPGVNEHFWSVITDLSDGSQKTVEFPGPIRIEALNDTYLFGQPFFEPMNGSWQVYDPNTMKLIDTISLPKPSLAWLYFFEDKVVAEDFIENILYYADLSAIGTDAFEWHTITPSA